MTTRLATDIGGTFTDIALETETGLHTAKVLTTADAPERGVLQGVEIVLSEAGIDAAAMDSFIHGTTLATNALIERKGARVALINTEGFRDTLEIGYENRYDQYDIYLEKPPPLVPRHLSFSIPERVDVDGKVLQPLDDSGLQSLVATLHEENISSVAVGLLHSYANPDHEQTIAARLRELNPELYVSLSCEVCPEVREFERLSTTVANAYVQPLIASYLKNLETSLRDMGFTCPLFMMTSGGGVTTFKTAQRFPVRLVESGPAGGAILAAHIAEQCDERSVVSFDMGGTTAKICLIDDFQPLSARRFEVARAARFIKGSGLPLSIPVIEMIEIGAGGGSIAGIDALQRITVGPQSAGSDPGPACYGRGGLNATVTDTDLLLGRLDAKRFGDSRLQLDPDAADKTIADSIGQRLELSVVEAAQGVSEVVDENMANAARVHAVERGKDIASRTMIAFGGAGPVHALRLAEKLQIDKVIIPPDPGVGSAVGFLRAPVAYETVRSRYMTLNNFDAEAVNGLFAELRVQVNDIVSAGAPGAEFTETRTAFMRYIGQGHEIDVPIPLASITADHVGLLRKRYEQHYARQYGRSIPGMDIEILRWSLAMATTGSGVHRPATSENGSARPTPESSRDLYQSSNGDFARAPAYLRNRLAQGVSLEGPLVVDEGQTTTVINSAWNASIDEFGNLVVERQAAATSAGATAATLSRIDLQVMWNRLLAVVEEQAQALIRTAFSPIVRESGDLSAGVFDRQGRMLAQAVTGTPGHINTMAESVRYFLDDFPLHTMRPGDVFVTNDPWLGSGHLNDFVVVQPCFMDASDHAVGLVACTSHLVDLGGLGFTADANDVYDEGLYLPILKLVDAGELNDTLLKIVKRNSRHPVQCEGDIFALLASAEVGCRRLQEMMNEFSLTTLDTVADFIIEHSQAATVQRLRELGTGEYHYSMLTDGYDAPIRLACTLTLSENELLADFSDSDGPSRYGINVPLNYGTAYTVFGLKCVIAPDIPNNAGSLAPLKVAARPGCIVNAQPPSPVAMRHIIGQLLPDTALGCLHQAIPDRVPAEGTSCLWDLPMRTRYSAGDETPVEQEFAVELVHNGGTGARPQKDGLSATAFPSGVIGSQVEITESTAPLLVRRRELRPDSGGAGKYRGGHGQIIEIEHRNGAEFYLSAAVDRIDHPARGRAGGEAGAAGRLYLRSGTPLKSKGEQLVPAGDRLIVETPGGGGYGVPAERCQQAIAMDLRSGLITSGDNTGSVDVNKSRKIPDAGNGR